MGLQASLSVPLFAARGVDIAALNLYGRDAHAMAPLITRIQQAIGFVMASDAVDEDRAYVTQRARAEEQDAPLVKIARTMLDERRR